MFYAADADDHLLDEYTGLERDYYIVDIDIIYLNGYGSPSYGADRCGMPTR